MLILRRRHILMTDEQLEQTLEALSAFLRTEEWAVETYRVALERVRDNPALRDALIRLLNSHAGRACLLRERIGEFGGAVLGGLGYLDAARHPSDAAAPWGAFANAFRRASTARDAWSLLAALHEGETWALRDYEADLVEVEPRLRDEFAHVVLAEQQRTWQQLEALAAAAGAGAPGSGGAGGSPPRGP